MIQPVQMQEVTVTANRREESAAQARLLGHTPNRSKFA